MGGEPLIERVAQGGRTALRAALALSITGWVLDVPALLGRYLYTEQLLALGAGLAAALVLIEPRGDAGPRRRALDLAFAAVVLGLYGYVALHYPSLQLSLALAPPAAVALGVAMIAGVLEAVRRRTGWFLPVLVVVLAGLAFVGPHLPETFQTRPVSFPRLVVYLALDTNALFSKVLSIATIVVAPFIVFGVLLNGFGGAAVFSRLAARLVGRFTGGPAKVSVVGSGAFGMISGSAVANVAAVGSVSIPMMARAGYPRHVAAAVEAVSSTGGQLVPPIMGASAFLMAELLEIPYREVALAAVVPAVLFYLALMLAVDFEARRLGLAGAHAQGIAQGMAEGVAEGIAGTLPGAPARGGWRYLLPVAVLIHLLFIEGRTAAHAGLMSTGALLLVHLAWPLENVGRRLARSVATLLESMTAVADIIMLAAAAGLVIGVLNLTGVAFAITLQILALSGGLLGVLLALTAVLSIALGLGMPTVGVYVLLATLVAPALVEVGVAPLAAHMYVLFFGMISMITPPVAIASFAAATVAKTDPWRTSFASLRVGAGVYLVPVAFVTQPELLLQGGVGELALALARVTLAVALAAAAATGQLLRPIAPPLRGAAAALAIANVLPRSAAAQDALLASAFVAGLALLAHHLRPVAKSP